MCIPFADQNCNIAKNPPPFQLSFALEVVTYILIWVMIFNSFYLTQNESIAKVSLNSIFVCFALEEVTYSKFPIIHVALWCLASIVELAAKIL